MAIELLLRVFADATDNLKGTWLRDLGQDWVFCSKTFPDVLILRHASLGAPGEEELLGGVACTSKQTRWRRGQCPARARKLSTLLLCTELLPVSVCGSMSRVCEFMRKELLRMPQ
uniref:Uncharacterized protein n=1 Tax=Rhodosorus marinus TaxID=101924 RepID=A0A7S0BPN6_9RHOD|mmetsp:Transcript_3865/g.5461  ORF Transcript_3865/g.5461 Transcript_3865/m.5461 type:complete len:115 (+) Transcript_3865:377-721(+)